VGFIVSAVLITTRRAHRQAADGQAPADAHSNGAASANGATPAAQRAARERVAGQAEAAAEPRAPGWYPPPDVCVVDTPEEARRVAALLTGRRLRDRVFACDTEVRDRAAPG